MASLLERMNVPQSGPMRNKSTSRASPYNRPPKGDPESAWTHDLFEGDASTSKADLSSRLSSGTVDAPRASLNVAARKAFAAATGASGELNIKGAAKDGNVVQIEGLVHGTTADDVKAIFKTCGQVVNAAMHRNPSAEPGTVTIRVTYKTPEEAKAAVKKFDGQSADGKQLKVHVVGIAGSSLAGRLGGGNMDIIREAGSVDVLMNIDSGSKMRSDALLSDSRAQVLVAPPGTNPKDYIPAGVRSSGGRGRGRGGRGGRRGGGRRQGGGGMDID